MKQRIIIILIAATIPFMSGCGKKWKKTSEAFFDVQLNKPTQDEAFIEITGGTLLVKKFMFEGTRKQGDDVVFEDDFEGEGGAINIALGTMVPVLNYDIPQGTYTEIKSKFEFGPKDANSTMQVDGIYHDNESGLSQSFTVLLNDDFESTITAQNSEGGNEIVIIAENVTGAKINLDMEEWFAVVPEELIKEAVADANKSVLIISKTENEAIYALIANRIGIGDEMMFE